MRRRPEVSDTDLGGPSQTGRAPPLPCLQHIASSSVETSEPFLDWEISVDRIREDGEVDMHIVSGPRQPKISRRGSRDGFLLTTSLYTATTLIGEVLQAMQPATSLTASCPAQTPVLRLSTCCPARLLASLSTPVLGRASICFLTITIPKCHAYHGVHHLHKKLGMTPCRKKGHGSGLSCLAIEEMQQPGQNKVVTC